MPTIARDRGVDRAEMDDFIRARPQGVLWGPVSRGGFPARLFPDEQA